MFLRGVSAVRNVLRTHAGWTNTNGPLHQQAGRQTLFRRGGGGSRYSTTTAPPPPVKVPTREQLRRHFINSSIMFVGIGFMDNLVMIQAADFIDQKLYNVFRFHALTCAALGQVVSDFAGVTFGIVVEYFVKGTRFLKESKLDHRQLKMPKVVRVGAMGSSLGVVAGCLLGMITLAGKDLDGMEVQKMEVRLEPIFQAFVHDGIKHLNAEYCNLWLVFDEEKEFIWSRARQYAPPSEEALRKAFNHCDTEQTGYINAKELVVAINQLGLDGFDIQEANRAIHESNETMLEDDPEAINSIEKHEDVDMDMEKFHRRKQARFKYRSLLDDERSKMQQDGRLSYEQFVHMMKTILATENIKIRLRPNGLKFKAIHQGEIIRVNRPRDDPSFNAKHNDVTGFETRNVLVAPIFSRTNKTQVIGVMEVANKQGVSKDTGFTETDVKLVELMCSNASTVLDQIAYKHHGDMKMAKDATGRPNFGRMQ